MRLVHGRCGHEDAVNGAVWPRNGESVWPRNGAVGESVWPRNGAVGLHKGVGLVGRKTVGRIMVWRMHVAWAIGLKENGSEAVVGAYECGKN